MLLPKVLVLITVLLPMAVSTDHVVNPKKREVSSYAVEGCFSSFSGVGLTKQMGGHNSNVKCQDVCRDAGYILASTKGDQCQCGNIFPKGKKVDDNQCTTRCRSWSPCHAPQSCCGGPSAYSVSVVGNIDVAKQVLRRLSYEWQTNTEYRKYMRSLLPIPSMQNHTERFHYFPWLSDVPHSAKYWLLCKHDRYITVVRNYYIAQQAICNDAPGYLYPEKGNQDCHNIKFWENSTAIGWYSCNDGYYLVGLQNAILKNAEGKCCRPRSQKKSWGFCTIALSLDILYTCPSGHYLVGFLKTRCPKDGQISNNCVIIHKCCMMGAYNGDSWAERPDLVIKVKDTSKQLKRCSMNAMDKSASSSTYQCKAISDRTNMLVLNALKFNIEDKSPLNVAKPTPIKGFRPAICSANKNSYQCSKSLATAIETSSTLTIGSGFSLAVSVGASVEISAGLFGSGTTTTFSAEVSATTSYDVESSKTTTYTTTDQTDISIEVPENTEITINLMRTVQDLEYKWKAVFELVGKYSAKWKKNDQESFDDVSTVLSGSKREMYAFGSWKYPGTDVLRVIITDKYGKEKSSGCEHEPGAGRNCQIEVKKA